MDFFATEHLAKRAAVALPAGPATMQAAAHRRGDASGLMTIHGVPGLPVTVPRTVRHDSYEGMQALGADPKKVRAMYAAEKAQDPLHELNAMGAVHDAVDPSSGHHMAVTPRPPTPTPIPFPAVRPPAPALKVR